MLNIHLHIYIPGEKKQNIPFVDMVIAFQHGSTWNFW